MSCILSTESFSYISRNGTFLYFRKQKPRKNSLYFRKRNFYISGKGNPKKLFIFQEVTSPFLESSLYFRKRNFLAPSLKNFLYFCMKIISAEMRKIIVLAFVRFRRSRTGALRKNF